MAHGLPPPVHRHQTNQQHEAQIRALQGRKRPINVLSTNSAWLLSSLVLGCNGLLFGSVIADLQAKLFRAVKANDLAEARRLNDRIYPMARVFYADPFVDMAQPHEGSAGPAWQTAARGGASAVGQDH